MSLYCYNPHDPTAPFDSLDWSPVLEGICPCCQIVLDEHGLCPKCDCLWEADSETVWRCPKPDEWTHAIYRPNYKVNDPAWDALSPAQRRDFRRRAEKYLNE